MGVKQSNHHFTNEELTAQITNGTVLGNLTIDLFPSIYHYCTTGPALRDNLPYLSEIQHNFSFPIGLCVDKHGDIFVCDYNGSEMVVFNSQGKHKLSWGRDTAGRDSEAKDGFFSSPYAACVHPETGAIVVVDRNRENIQTFTPEGKFLKRFGEGHLRTPQAIGIDAEGNYVVATGENNIHLFKPDGTYSRGLDCGAPTVAVCVDLRTNHYLAAQVGDAKIVILDSQGTVIRKFGGDSAVKDPYSLITDGTSKIIIAEYTGHKVKVFTPEGEFLQQIGEQGREPGQMSAPLGLAITPQGNLVVVDNGNRRVTTYGM